MNNEINFKTETICLNFLTNTYSVFFPIYFWITENVWEKNIYENKI